MSTNDVDAQKARRKNRNTLIALVVVFFGPMLLAYVAYQYYSGHDPAETKNRGQLINPPHELPAFELATLAGEPLRLEDLKGKWTLTYIGEGKCTQPCADALAKIKQARLLQGGELKRINRLYLMTDIQADVSLEKVLQDHPGLIVARGGADQLEPVLRKFEIPYQRPAAEAHRVYIIDPQGFVMMSYPPGFDTVDLVKDIKHLLRASWFG